MLMVRNTHTHTHTQYYAYIHTIMLSTAKSCYPSVIVTHTQTFHCTGNPVRISWLWSRHTDGIWRTDYYCRVHKRKAVPHSHPVILLSFNAYFHYGNYTTMFKTCKHHLLKVYVADRLHVCMYVCIVMDRIVIMVV